MTTKQKRRRALQRQTRFPPNLLAAVDKASEQVRRERPGSEITFSETVRTLIAEALKARHIEI